MHKNILILTLLACASCASLQSDSRIAILPHTEYTSDKIERYWDPRPADFAAIRATILTCLHEQEKMERSKKNEWQADEIKKVIEHYEQYRLQFVGVVIDGRQHVFCNAFPAAKDPHGYIDRIWRSKTVAVFDGGFWFWRILVDVEEGKCVFFNSNGYA